MDASELHECSHGLQAADVTGFVAMFFAIAVPLNSVTTKSPSTNAAFLGVAFQVIVFEFVPSRRPLSQTHRSNFCLSTHVYVLPSNFNGTTVVCSLPDLISVHVVKDLPAQGSRSSHSILKAYLRSPVSPFFGSFRGPQLPSKHSAFVILILPLKVPFMDASAGSAVGGPDKAAEQQRSVHSWWASRRQTDCVMWVESALGSTPEFSRTFRSDCTASNGKPAHF